MYDPVVELDFNDIDTLMDELTYGTAVYNHEENGMPWDDIERLFPDNGPLMRARYKAKNPED